MERPTPYRVSTITCNGDIGTSLALRSAYEHIEIVERGTPGGGWIFVELSLSESRGLDPNVKRRNNPDRKSFVNQVTVIRDMGTPNYMPNIKLFKNGNVHMTGVRKLEDGERIVAALADEVRRIQAGPMPDIVPEGASIVPGNFKCRMMNCDFTVPFLIRRKDLHNMLIARPFNNISSFQPGTYPGVKIHYFWNTFTADNTESAHDAKELRNGRCECMMHGADNMCIGKGCGRGVGDCKKVTIAAFESGKVLITGATSVVQVEAAYAYICNILMMHKARLQKVLVRPA